MAFLEQGLSLLVQIGASYLLGRFTAPSQKPSDNLDAQNGDYGIPIPRVFGEEVRYSTPYMAQDDILETEHEVQDYSEVVGAISGAAQGFLIGGPVGAAVGAVVGFIFGAATPNQKYYTYSDTFALLIADRHSDDPIEDVTKIWAQGRIIFDSSQQSPTSETYDSGQLVSRTYGQNRYFKSLTIYGGGGVQTVDPALSATIGETVAYRYTAYAVIEKFQLENFGNTMPGTFECLVVSKTGQTLAEVMETISGEAGIDATHNLSSTALTGYSVRGYAITNQTNCWDAISPLLPVFRVDAGENAGQVRFYTRERGLRATIPLSELGAYEYGNSPPDRINYSRSEDIKLPKETSLTFSDPERDYLPNTATSRRSEGDAQSNVATTIALTLSTDEAATAVATMHWDAWLGRIGISSTLTDNWISLTPGVCFGIPFEDAVLPYRMTRKTRGANGIIEADFVSAENVAFQGTIAGGSAAIPEQESTLFADTRIVPIDMPISEDAHDDFGFYIAMAGTASYWTRGKVQVSGDGSTYSTLLDAVSESIIGDVVGTLATGTTTGWDDTLDTTSVLTVTLLHSGMTLSSVTDADLDAWKNFAYVGQDGQGEYLQFKTATNTSGNTWELTNLRRGRRGTDWGMVHSAGDEFVLFGEGGIYRIVAVDDTGWGDALTLRGVTLNQDPADADTVAFTNNGEGKKPFSVINLSASFDGSGNLTLTWDARLRSFSDAFDLPLSFEVDVYKSGVFKRTISVSAETADYSITDQTSDGFTEGDGITVSVYQVNDDYGRGHVRTDVFLAPATAMIMEDDSTPVLMEDDFEPVGLG